MGSSDIRCLFHSAGYGIFGDHGGLFDSKSDRRGKQRRYFSSLPAIIANLAWILAFGPIAMFVPVAIRAMSPTLRNHFRWLAMLAAVTGVFFIAPGIFSSFITPDEGSILSGVFFLAVGYCLYRSARSLVPLNRISSSIEPDAPPFLLLTRPDAGKLRPCRRGAQQRRRNDPTCNGASSNLFQAQPQKNHSVPSITSCRASKQTPKTRGYQA